MHESECKICGKPKQASGSGSLTQFISVCSCALAKEVDLQEKEVVIQLCKTCGKRIGKGREGSMTQYIFRADICECDVPVSINKTVISEPGGVSLELADDEEEDELELEADSFPLKRFKPLRKLGRGASGQVYLARDKILKKRVAVKTLHVLTPEQLISFQEEARATSKLRHPNIVEILDFGATDLGAPYMVLEFFDGENLETLASEHGTFDWSTVKSILKRLAEALQYSHEQGIFHRDLKPSNVLVKDIFSEEIQVKLIDFGVAKVSELTGQTTEFQGKTLAGTPSYMSPDVPLGHVYNEKSEVYSLGCLAFRLLTGIPPFTGDTALDVLAKHAQEPPPSINDFVGESESVSPQAERIVSICLEKDPLERFESMDDLIQNLDIGGHLKREVAPKRKNIRLGRVLLAAVAIATSIIAIGMNMSSEEKTKVPKARKIENVLNQIEYKPIVYDIGTAKNKWIRPEKVSGVITDRDFLTMSKDLRDKSDILLDLSRCEFRGDGLKHLRKIDLVRVNLESSVFSFENLKYLNFPSLKNLILKATSITDKDLAIVKELKNLAALDLTGCKKISNKGLNELLTDSNLKVVRLADTNIGDGAFRGIRNSKLTELEVTNSKISETDLCDLGAFRHLQVLKVGYCKAASLKGIGYLCLRNKNLRQLDMSFIGNDYIPLKFLENENKLNYLNVFGLPITDDDLAILGKLKNMKFLNISEAMITDKGLRHLHKLKLAVFSLSGCQNVTKEGIRQLIKKMPSKCQVITNFGNEFKAKESIHDIESFFVEE